VRLVDRHERRLELSHLPGALGVGQLLRRGEQEAGPTRLHFGQRRRLLARRLGGADPHRPQLRQAAIVERGDLVLLQREQRGDNDRRSGQESRRELIDGGLPATGGQHHEGVPFA
jgi:hypothetical protein